MTSITLTISGARARVIVNGPLTSGMMGLPVILEYDDSWNGLTKNLVCRCGKWGPEKGETRTVLNIGERTTVAHEVMKSGMNLYLGVEGYSADGKLVIPTAWADCGKIQPGANADADPSACPKLPIWGQLQTEINHLKTQTITEDQIAVSVAAYLEENPIEVPEAPQSSALNTAQITSLDNLFRVCAFTKADVSAEYAAFQTAFGISGDEEPDIPEEPDEPVNPEVTLNSISANYTGGDVPAGTALADLTGLAVTAYYSDGCQYNVTGYTLNGEIAEGENTITVSYGGMTTTFTVNGTAAIVADWTSSTAYDLTGKIITGLSLSDSNGAESANENKAASDYFNCYGADYLYHYQGSVVIHFYDAGKNWIRRAYLNKVPSTVAVPENTAYFRLCGGAAVLTETKEKVIPITKAANNYTLGEQTLVWENGDYDENGNPTSSTKKRTGIFPISGASSLTFGENVNISTATLYDAHQNFVVRVQNIVTPIDLSAEPYAGYSYMTVVAYSEDTITLA